MVQLNSYSFNLSILLLENETFNCRNVYECYLAKLPTLMVADVTFSR
uniref:Uncharacterized protein n=1 Tax=Anguilla anguilla TaxID=7936 RepID=A0A0E9QHU6_ANGAN